MSGNKSAYVESERPIWAVNSLRREASAIELHWAVRCLMLLAFILVVCFRMPQIFSGRIWAEEAYFYLDALVLPWSTALFAAFGGYLNLVANAAAVLARYTVPFEDAPWITTGIGLLFQICPAVLILTSRATWLRPTWAVAAALLVVAIPPDAEEVWLQTLHVQYHLTLCAALVLTFDDAGSVGAGVRWFRRVLLLLGPLCGLPAIVLLPLFVLRAVTDRSRERIVETSVLLLASMVQILGFYSGDAAASVNRTLTIWLGLYGYAFYIRQVLEPFLGTWAATQIAPGIRASVAGGHAPILPAVITVSFLLATGVPAIRRWRQAPIWLLAAALIIAAVSYYGAINGGTNLLQVRSHERYNYMPGVLIDWALVALAVTGAWAPVRWGARVALVWLLLLAVVAYPASASSWFASGPSWQSEVRLWRSDPNHAITLWPEGWLLILSPFEQYVQQR